MNKIWFGLFLVVSVGCSSLRPQGGMQNRAPAMDIVDVSYSARGEEEAPRHRLLVLPFLDERPDKAQAVTDVARQTVIRELLRTNQFVVVSLDDFPQDPKKYLTEENEYDLAQISKLAAGMGVSAVIEGKVMNIKAKKVGDTLGLIRQLRAQVSTEVRVRVYAGKNGKEILNELRTAETEASTTHVAQRGDLMGSLSDDPELVRIVIRKAFLSSVPNLTRSVEKLNWEGRVAMVNGERIFVNAGRLSGLQVGDILKVTEEGNDVYDPDTGRFIGSAPGRLKGTIEVVSYFGKDGAIAVIHSGSGFQENDRLELY